MNPDDLNACQQRPPRDESTITSPQVEVNRPLRIFISAPYSDNPAYRMEQTSAFARKLDALGYDSYCPHLALHWLEGEPNSWERALEICEREILLCDELWFWGTSKGVEREKEYATQHNIPVKDGTKELKR